MTMTGIAEHLNANPYPGRLIILARTGDGVLNGGYALTGRSASSRARRFDSRPGELRVVPTVEADHDALRHYVAATCTDVWTVYGNGEQVGEVADRLARNLAPSVALEALAYEPDSPIFTPRITAVVHRSTGQAWFGAARHARSARTSADCTTVAVGELAPGDAVLLSTYDSDGEQILTAPCHHDLRTTAADAAALLDELWSALDPRFAVAATVFSPQDDVLGHARHA
jgi:IMP cyclohydrolase